MMTLSDCHPTFQGRIQAVAKVNGKSAAEVYALWRVYSADCSDQSAIFSEFLKWYEAELPKLPSGESRLG